jgi:hypothetical protein
MSTPQLVLPFAQTSLFTKSSFKMIEHYDLQVIKALLRSSYLLDTKPYDDEYLSGSFYYPFANEKKQLEELSKYVKNNKFICEYDFTPSTKVGRVYAKKALGFISLRKELRSLFAKDAYVDIDVVNAHPEIICQLCQDTMSLTVLPAYVANREAYLEQMQQTYNVSRNKAKQAVIATLYGASLMRVSDILDSNYELLDWNIALHNEIQRVCSYIRQANPKLDNMVKIKHDGTERSENGLLSYYIQEHERIILETVYNFLIAQGIFSADGRNEGALCYDGIMVSKHAIGTRCVVSLMNEMSKEVKLRTGFNLQFTTKEMEVSAALTQAVEEGKNAKESTFNINSKFEEMMLEKSDVIEWYQYFKRKFEYGDGDTPIRFSCGSNFYYVDDQQHLICKNARSFKDQYRKFSSIKCEGKVYNFLNVWFDDPNQASYEKIVCDIDVDNTPSRYYNCYKGLAASRNSAEVRPDEIMDLVDPLVGDDGLLYYISGKNKEVMHYVLKVLSAIVKAKTPAQRPGVMILFRDIQGQLAELSSGGTGKDSFINWFGTQIIGSEYYYEPSSTSSFFDKFNDSLDSKIFINISELGSLIKETKNWDKFKVMVSSNTIEIEGKGRDKETKTNIMNIVASTNNDFTLPYDRRVLVIDVSKEKKNDQKYWNNIHHNVFADPRVAKAFYLYLTTIVQPYKTSVEFEDHKPTTAAQQEQIAEKVPLLQQFFEDVHLNNLFINKDQISNSEVYETYKRWLEYNGHREVLTTTKMNQKLKRMCEELASFNKTVFLSPFRNSSYRGYKLDYDKLLQWYSTIYPDQQPLPDLIVRDSQEKIVE